MIIEDKITEFMDPMKKVNENIIYIANIEFEVTKSVKIKNRGIAKKRRILKLKDQLFQKNPGELNRIHSMSMFREKLELKEKELLEIKKVILKKELSCSFYKR